MSTRHGLAAHSLMAHRLAAHRLAAYRLAAYRLAAALLLALGGGSAQAIAVAGGEPGATGRADKGSRTLVAAPAPGQDAPTLSLMAARIEAVDAEGRAITVRGKPVPLHPTQLRVLGPRGQPASGARALRPGMQVRFALEPEVAVAAAPASAARPGTAPAEVPARRIVLIYID